MGWFKKLFGIKDKEYDEIIKEPTTETGVICDFCKKEIFQHEKRRKIASKAFHKKCFKNIVKQEKKKIFG